MVQLERERERERERDNERAFRIRSSVINANGNAFNYVITKEA